MSAQPTATLQRSLPIVPSRTRVLDEGARAHYWREILRLWRVSPDRTFFPGAHPMAVDRNTVRQMRTHPYVVSLKTDGTRFLLLLTHRPNEQPVAILCDRAMTMYEVHVWAASSFFTGTLIDGELAWERNGCALHYLVFDAVAVSGEHVANRTFGERLQIIHDVLFVPWRDMHDDELERHVRDERKICMRQSEPHKVVIRPKGCAPMRNACSVWDARHASPYRNDGLLFTQTDAPMPVGRTTAMLKWKPHHTIDIDVSSTTDGALLTLASDASGERVPLAGTLRDLTAIDVERNAILEALPLGGSMLVECLVTCWDTATGRLALLPLRVRDDKTHPNAISTILRTLQTVAAGWTVPHIIKLSSTSPGDARKRHQPR